jgi:hypothetical protein
VTLAQFREETAGIREELGVIRGELRAIRGNGAGQSLAKLHEEIVALRGPGGEGLTLVALQAEIAALRGPGGEGLTLVALQAEIAALRGPGGEGLTLMGLRQEIRDGDEETRRLMRVLHEDLVQRIALLGERSSVGIAPRRRGARRKKNHGRKR